jgi:hypothetical protein
MAALLAPDVDVLYGAQPMSPSAALANDSVTSDRNNVCIVDDSRTD